MTREEAIRILASSCIPGSKQTEALETLIPELRESEDERIRKEIIHYILYKANGVSEKQEHEWIAYLEKQKENPKSADSISSDCMSDAKCEDRWHKVGDSLPDNGRLVLAKDCLGNVLLARYDGENWEVNVYDNEDHYCHNSISKWCEIPSEKQKEQKPADLSEMMVHKEPYIASVPTPMVADEQKPAKPSGKLSRQDYLYQLLIDQLITYSDYEYLIGHKPSEWSEEDEKMKERLITRLNWITHNTRTNGTSPNITFFDEIEWLKSLRPSWKPSEVCYGAKGDPDPAGAWKPSEEQMKALESCGQCNKQVYSLYLDLKKL